MYARRNVCESRSSEGSNIEDLEAVPEGATKTLREHSSGQENACAKLYTVRQDDLDPNRE